MVQSTVPGEHFLSVLLLQISQARNITYGNADCEQRFHLGCVKLAEAEGLFSYHFQEFGLLVLLLHQLITISFTLQFVDISVIIINFMFLFCLEMPQYFNTLIICNQFC